VETAGYVTGAFCKMPRSKAVGMAMAWEQCRQPVMNNQKSRRTKANGEKSIQYWPKAIRRVVYLLTRIANGNPENQQPKNMPIVISLLSNEVMNSLKISVCAAIENRP
jgi:hypothetical protein